MLDKKKKASHAKLKKRLGRQGEFAVRKWWLAWGPPFPKETSNLSNKKYPPCPAMRHLHYERGATWHLSINLRHPPQNNCPTNHCESQNKIATDAVSQDKDQEMFR